VIDERTLRELYLLPFELAVREGGSLGVMTAYNRLNGIYSPDNLDLLDGILRGEWGFEGFVVTDWFAQGSTVAAAHAGLDLEMPGPRRFYGGRLAESVRAGDLDERHVDAAVRRLLGVFDRIGALADEPGVPEAIDRPEHRQVAREAAAASVVLLRNDGVLPLELSSGTLAVIGPNAARTAIMGGGSAQLAPHYRVTVLDALREQLDGVEIVHEPGADILRSLPVIESAALTAPDGSPGLELELFAGPDLAGDVVARQPRPSSELFFFGPPDPAAGRVFSGRLRGAFTPDVTGPWELSIAVAGRGRLRVDGQVVIDGMDEALPHGPSFLGMGSVEVRARVELVEGRAVELELELANPGGSVVSGARVGARPAPAPDLIDRAVAAAASADAVVVVVGTTNEWESEGHDRETMDLPGAQDELVARVLDVRPDAVVLVNTGAPVTMPWADRAHALAQIWFGGQEAGNGVVDVLTGRADPGGRLPHSIPRRLEHNPSYGNFPPEDGQVRYGEGLLMGYRWYEARHLPVAYPFGHGLSYSRFELGPPRLSATTFTIGSTLRVEVDVTNTGGRPGSEVVQCYVGQPDAKVLRPPKELKAFAKVALEPGATTTVTFELGDRAFAYWRSVDPVSAELAAKVDTWLTSTRPADAREEPGWTIDAGTYLVHVGRSSADIAHVVEVDVPTGGLVPPA
jgi:beta-glucosidase